MPLTELFDNAGGESSLLGNGAPVTSTFFKEINGVTVSATSDYQHIIYDPREDRFIIQCNDATLGGVLMGVADPYEKVQSFTNQPGVITSADPVRLNYLASQGFLITVAGGAPGNRIGDTLNPATCVYSVLPNPGVTSTVGLFSVQGQICAIGGDLLLYASDNGVTWNLGSVGGWGDIDHGGNSPTVSPDGSMVALDNATGTTFLCSNPIAGPAGAVATIVHGFATTTVDAFNTDASIYLFCFNGSGRIFVCQAASGYVPVEIPALGNAFIFGSLVTTATPITSIKYSPFHAAFIIRSSAAVIGILKESDLTKTQMGVFGNNALNQFSGISSPSEFGINDAGKMLGVGSNCICWTNLGA